MRARDSRCTSSVSMFTWAFVAFVSMSRPFSKDLQMQISPLTLYYMQMSAVRVCFVGGVQPE